MLVCEYAVCYHICQVFTKGQCITRWVVETVTVRCYVVFHPYSGADMFECFVGEGVRFTHVDVVFMDNGDASIVAGLPVFPYDSKPRCDQHVYDRVGGVIKPYFSNDCDVNVVIQESFYQF